MASEVGGPIAIDGVRELIGNVVEDTPPRGARALLAATRLHCQKGGPELTGLDCVQCARFVNFRPSRDRRTVAVRCHWRLDDPVADLMTRLPAVATVEPDWHVADADDRARRLGIHQLLVTRGNELVGIVARRDLAPPAREGEHVADRMQTELIAIPPETSLERAAALMIAHGIGCLPVVAEGRLIGVVTRGDLRAVGVSEARLVSERAV